MSEQNDPIDFQRSWSREVFAVQRSIRYHARRERFYDSWNDLTNGIAIFLGAATVATVAGRLPLAQTLAVWFPAAIAIVSTLNVVWGTTRRARLHNELYRRFVELERTMLSASEPTGEGCRALRAERLAIEADEPPTMLVVRVLCHNEVVRASGAGQYYEVPLWQRVLAHFWAFPNAYFAPPGKKADA